MNAKLITVQAQANFHRVLQQNPYPGRGIVAGLDETGRYMVQVYWIMGRSENSRNRVFRSDELKGRLCTEAADPSKVKDSSLIIYNAMREGGRYDALQEGGSYYVVSNGDQTDTVIENFRYPYSLESALRTRGYEPDDPNFTQRITAVSRLDYGREQCLMMSILRKSRFRKQCDRVTYELNSEPGLGFCITTYSSDGDPLPPFYGDPIIMPLVGGMLEIAQTYWGALDESNRVSLAVKWIEIANGRSAIHIINKYQAVTS